VNDNNMRSDLTPSPRKRPLNLTIREDIVCEAKALKLNTSQAGETGILSSIKDAKTRELLKSNQSALAPILSALINPEYLLSRSGWENTLARVCYLSLCP
jgi:post-segregation antitoxin (ccd killing protein)